MRRPETAVDYMLLLTEEDAMAQTIMPAPAAGTVGLLATEGRSPLAIGAHARQFATGAVSAPIIAQGEDAAQIIIQAAREVGTTQIVTSYTPVGPTAQRLKEMEPAFVRVGITLQRIRRDYDSLTWPHASKGFFALKKQIPALLREMGLAA